MSPENRIDSALASYRRQDPGTTPHFERLVRLASRLSGLPQAWLGLLEADGLRMGAALGLAGGLRALDAAQRHSLALAAGEEFWQGEPTRDPLWPHPSWPAGSAAPAFMARVLLRTPEGFNLGLLCVAGPTPRALDRNQTESLQALAAQALLLLEYGRQQTRWDAAEAQNRQARQWQQLQQQAQRIAGQVAEVGGWILSLPERQFAWSPEVAHIHGMGADATVTVRQALRLYGPEDRARLRQAYRTCVREGARFELELRLRRADAQTIWVRLIGEAVHEEAGRLVAVQGAIENIDARKRAKKALRDSEQRFRMAARATTDVVWDWDLAEDSLWWSEGLTALFGIEPQALGHGSRCRSARIHPDERASVEASLQAALLGNQEQWSAEYRFQRGDGSYAQVLDRGFVIRDEQGRARRMVGGLKDLTAQHQARDEARRELETRMAIVRIQQEIAHADLGLDAMLELMARRAAELTGSDGSSVELVEAQHSVCMACTGMLSPYQGQRIPLDETVAGQVLQHNRTVRCQDTEADERVHRPLSRALGVRSLIVAPLKAGEQVVGVMRVVSQRPAAFSLRDETSLQILVVTLGDVIQRQRLSAQLRASEAQYRLLFDLNPQPMWVHGTRDLRLLAVNKAMVAHYGYSAEALRHMRAPDFWVDDSAESRQARLDSIQRGDMHLNSPRRHRRRDGSLIDVEVTANSITFDGQPARLVIATDVTERQRTARELLRVNRAQRVLGACSEALVRANTELGLLEDVTRIAVEVGGYRLAWVGYGEPDAEPPRLRPVSRHGLGGGFLDTAVGADDAPHPAEQAWQDERLRVIEDLSRTETPSPWVQQACEHGQRGLVCLPLRVGLRRLGVLSLHTAEPFEPSEAELQLLQSLAKDLAFGIGNLRAQEEQNRLQHAVLKLATAVSASTGTEFFDQLARNMTEALGAQAGFVARLLPEAPTRLRLIAAQVDGQPAPAADYPAAGRPCEQVLREGMGLVRQGLSTVYPGLQQRPPAQAYLGRRLDNAAGEPVGLVFVLFDRPLVQTGFLVSALHIFAARAGAELARLAADSQIRDQASLLDKAQDAIIVRRIGGGLSYWNKGAERLYGFTAAQALDPQQGWRIERDCLHFDLEATGVLNDGEWSGEIEQHRQDGTALTVESRWTLVHDAFGAPEAILSINTDVTARKRAEQQIQRLAFFDALTGLPNRQLLMDRLQHALAGSTRSGAGGALLFIDLDNFKTLNDTLGHDQGDELLRQVAQRLSGCVRESDTVARLGGDEFVVMLENLGQRHAEVVEHARQIGAKVLAAMGQPFVLAGHQHESSCSIGVAPFMDGGSGISDLLKQADLAMYQAKTAGRNTLRFFDPAMQAEVSARAALEAALRQALARGEFLLHYQPQTEQGRRVSGVEALVRWRHPVHGMVSPADFIPLAEDTGLIIPLGRWVLDSACRLLARWAGQAETESLSVAVNVSSRQFKHPDFVQHVMDALQAHGARPERLKLELTESLLVDDMDAIIERMGLLKALGVGFSLDDFGTGYSSLSYLKRLPLDQLKIDQSFVRDVLTDPNDAAIVRTIITLGRSLGLAVIAEGVESSEQRDFLARHDCHAFQGYAFGRPMADPELTEFLSQHRLH